MEASETVLASNGVRVLVPNDLLLYFSMDPIPCLVVGCHWAGQKVGAHCYHMHGIPSREMRVLIGANKSQGLCSPQFSELQSDRAKSQVNVLISGEQRYDLSKCRHIPKKQSQQAIQNAVKVRESASVRDKLRKAGEKSREPHRREINSQTVKRTWALSAKVIKICDECGQQYETFAIKASRSRFCGLRCRNSFNRRRRKNERSATADS